MVEVEGIKFSDMPPEVRVMVMKEAFASANNVQEYLKQQALPHVSREWNAFWKHNAPERYEQMKAAWEKGSKELIESAVDNSIVEYDAQKQVLKSFINEADCLKPEQQKDLIDRVDRHGDRSELLSAMADNAKKFDTNVYQGFLNETAKSIVSRNDTGWDVLDINLPRLLRTERSALIAAIPNSAFEEDVSRAYIEEFYSRPDERPATPTASESRQSLISGNSPRSRDAGRG